MSKIEETDIKIVDNEKYENKKYSAYKSDESNLEKNDIPFWIENPNIIFNQQYFFEFFPTEDMTYSQKLNAVSRMVIYLTFFIFIFTKSFRLLIVSAITLFSIYFLYNHDKQEKQKKENKNLENFDNIAQNVLEENNLQMNSNVFSTPTSINPFSNVLISDYDYNVNKKPAAPSYNTNVNADILNQAKQLVKEANPDQPDISDKLFKDLGEQFVFEQSLRPFHSNPSTTIPNDQQGFAEFCYGSMVSCKEGNLFACARNLARHTN
jgi:hypothetical protein